MQCLFIIKSPNQQVHSNLHCTSGSGANGSVIVISSELSFVLGTDNKKKETNKPKKIETGSNGIIT